MPITLHALGHLRLHAAHCDDCGAVVLVAPTEAALYWMLAQRDLPWLPTWLPTWRPGLPIFCGDLLACSERCWRRYGAHLQAVIDSINQLEAAQAVMLRADARVELRARP